MRAILSPFYSHTRKKRVHLDSEEAWIKKGGWEGSDHDKEEKEHTKKISEEWYFFKRTHTNNNVQQDSQVLVWFENLICSRLSLVLALIPFWNLWYWYKIVHHHPSFSSSFLSSRNLHPRRCYRYCCCTWTFVQKWARDQTVSVDNT